jgi:hypothetical protein
MASETTLMVSESDGYGVRELRCLVPESNNRGVRE